jgi:hypothetical protein
MIGGQLPRWPPEPGSGMAPCHFPVVSRAKKTGFRIIWRLRPARSRRHVATDEKLTK